MHFEIVIEDQSGEKFLNLLMPRIIGDCHSFNIHSYKGIGRIPKNLKGIQDARHCFFLEQLPKLLDGYGQTFTGWLPHFPACLVVVCDLDTKCMKEFRNELLSLLNRCYYRPETHFCFAIEEMEAWFLGDTQAIKQAYPNTKDNVLVTYLADSICGTWEKLADAIYPGGSKKLMIKGWQAIGHEKSIWAESITPFIDLTRNQSPSFQYFVTKIRQECNK